VKAFEQVKDDIIKYEKTLVRVNWKERNVPVALTPIQIQYLTMGLRNLTVTRKVEIRAMSQNHISHQRTPLTLERDPQVAHL
jgi:hypothetical protein